MIRKVIVFCNLTLPRSTFFLTISSDQPPAPAVHVIQPPGSAARKEGRQRRPAPLPEAQGGLQGCEADRRNRVLKPDLFFFGQLEQLFTRLGRERDRESRVGKRTPHLGWLHAVGSDESWAENKESSRCTNIKYHRHIRSV